MIYFFINTNAFNRMSRQKINNTEKRHMCTMPKIKSSVFVNLKKSSNET